MTEPKDSTPQQAATNIADDFMTDEQVELGLSVLMSDAMTSATPHIDRAQQRRAEALKRQR